MSDDQLKVLYFAPLPEGRTHAAFRDRWRRHGRLAMSLPMWANMTSYRQFDVLVAGEDGLSGRHLVPTATGYGGFGSIGFRDDLALESVWADPDVQTLCADEVQTFGRELGPNLVAVRERVVVDDGPAALHLIVTAHRASGTSREAFAEAWRALGDRVAEAPELRPHLDSLVQHHALPGSDAWDGAAQLGFADVAALDAFTEAVTRADWLRPERREWADADKEERVLAREVLLYDEALGVDVRAAGQTA